MANGKSQLSKSCRVISVFGPSASQTLVQIPREEAEALFGKAIGKGVAPARMLDAVSADLVEFDKSRAGISHSALAVAAITLAYELDDPFNSATSKGQCAKALMEILDRLRELAPAEKEADGVDDLTARRANRRGETAAAH